MLWSCIREGSFWTSLGRAGCFQEDETWTLQLSDCPNVPVKEEGIFMMFCLYCMTLCWKDVTRWKPQLPKMSQCLSQFEIISLQQGSTVQSMNFPKPKKPYNLYFFKCHKSGWKKCVNLKDSPETNNYQICVLNMKIVKKKSFGTLHFVDHFSVLTWSFPVNLALLESLFISLCNDDLFVRIMHLGTDQLFSSEKWLRYEKSVPIHPWLHQWKKQFIHLLVWTLLFWVVGGFAN